MKKVMIGFLVLVAIVISGVSCSQPVVDTSVAEDSRMMPTGMPGNGSANDWTKSQPPAASSTSLRTATSVAAISGVYWCAMDMPGSPLGNHTFILIVYPSITIAQELLTKFGIKYEYSAPNQSGTQFYFTTLAAYSHSPWSFTQKIKFGNLYPDESNALKQYINPAKYTKTFKSDWDLEARRLDLAPLKNHFNVPYTYNSFVTELASLASTFETNYKNGIKCEYDLWDRNCSTWVNTMFQLANVSKTTRKNLGNLEGIDWGENDLLPTHLFVPRPIPYLPATTSMQVVRKFSNGAVMLVQLNWSPVPGALKYLLSSDKGTIETASPTGVSDELNHDGKSS